MRERKICCSENNKGSNLVQTAPVKKNRAKAKKELLELSPKCLKVYPLTFRFFLAVGGFETRIA
jgi:hypothetical protein